MASMKEIREHIASIQSTQKVTKSNRCNRKMHNYR